MVYVDRLPGARPQLYIAPLPTHEANSAVSLGLSPWTAVDLQNQQQHMMSQPHHHHQGPGSHYFTASSPTSPPPAQYAYDPIYQSNNNGGYPSSTSSNDPAMTQEEADLLDALATGLSVRQAAADLYLSGRTAQRRLASARVALGVSTTREAVVAWTRRSRTGN